MRKAVERPTLKIEKFKKLKERVNSIQNFQGNQQKEKSMLEIKEERKVLIVTFKSSQEKKENLKYGIIFLIIILLLSLILIGLNIIFLIKVFCYVVFVLFIFYWGFDYKIKIYFEKEKMLIKKQYRKKEKELLSLLYKEIERIERIERIYSGGKGYHYYLKITMVTGKVYDFLKYTDLKEELDEIIKIYEEAKKRVPDQETFNEYMNTQVEHFKLENAKRNMSHVDEMPGKGGIEKIVKDMEDFMSKKRGK